MEHGNGSNVERFVERGVAAQHAIDAAELEREFAERIELRCTTEDLERWREAARARGLSVSAFLRIAGREQALHPAIEAGAFTGTMLELARRGVDALERFALQPHTIRAHVAAELERARAGELPPKRKPAKKPAKKKPARRR